MYCCRYPVVAFARAHLPPATFLRPSRGEKYLLHNTNYPTSTFNVRVVSLPRMSMTLTCTVYVPAASYVCLVVSSSFLFLRVR